MISQLKELQNVPHFSLITTDEMLAEVCAKAQEKSAVALDTEFIRTRTFFPKLGLIQLYDGENLSLIDPNDIEDFSPFVRLLADNKVTKILHACSEDLEVFQHYFDQLPNPMFDTQVAAAFLGFGHSVGFAALIKHYFYLEIDKGASRTDWLARPLSEKQLRYAAADVWYLLPLYHQIRTVLAETRWQSAVEFDCDFLVQKREKQRDTENAYLSVANAWRLNREELMRLKVLAKWRLEEAIKRDLAVNFVVKEEHLWLVAKNNPKHTSELLAMGLLTAEVRIHGKKLLQLADQVKRIDEKDYPPLVTRLADDPRYRKALKSLQQKLKDIAPPDLAAEVIAGKRALEELMKWHWLQQQDPNCLPLLLCDWRREFGQALVNLL
ncbi:ribonuclease D [Caviibacterium pharyngocola]|uniref:Ribonuclease D n=1 Tax=Caviibacterium pharyngocola TaxID=28159 RepID=A0A2M8RV11_9PAST|nr:ribonuclease D [Caviibacterium pharyngocola]PJG82728.1 ribonuclease D [Caviibacterium pharyngocola]